MIISLLRESAKKMSKREEIINESSLEDIVGGKLRWQGGYVFPVNDPTHRYKFYNYEEATDYIKNNWGGGEHNEDTLIWLEEAGYVTRAY